MKLKLMPQKISAGKSENYLKSGIEIRKEKLEGWDAVVIENDYYQVTLLPKCGRLPYSFYYKPVKQDYFVHPVPLTTPQNGEEHIYYGGLIDSIPWVSGKVNGKSAPERFPIKGYLHFSPWKWITGKGKHSVFWEGENTFTYQEPVSGKVSTLTFKKRITGYADSSKLKMDYWIKNTGKSKTSFTLAIHSRTMINQYDRGAYFHAPGNKCYLYECYNEKSVDEKGMKLFSWVNWPFEEARHLSPRKDVSYLFTYHPEKWCVAGDAKSSEAFFYIANEPVKYKNRTDVLKMGSFMTNAAHFIQPCISYALQSDKEIWEMQGSTASLEKGEECSFSLFMVPHEKMKEEDVVNLFDADEDFLLLEKIILSKTTTGFRLKGKMIFASDGELTVKADNKPIKKLKISKGRFNFADIGEMKTFSTEIIIEFSTHENVKIIKIF